MEVPSYLRGALLGGALFVLAPTAGVEVLASVGLSGAGAIVGHFRQNADPNQLEAATSMLWGDLDEELAVDFSHFRSERVLIAS